MKEWNCYVWVLSGINNWHITTEEKNLHKNVCDCERGEKQYDANDLPFMPIQIYARFLCM